jgi:hypothetical protein
VVDFGFWWLYRLSVCRCELYWTAIHTHLYVHPIANFYSVCNIDADIGPYLNLYTDSDIYTYIHANKYSDANAYANIHPDQHFDTNLYTYIHSNQHTLSDSHTVTASDCWAGGLQSLGRCWMVQRRRNFGVDGQ